MKNFITLKPVVLLAVVFLTGCDKFLSSPLGSGALTTASTKQGTPVYILGMGQSNMANWTDAKADLSRALGRPVVFYNCALGGTYVRQWAVGGSLFEACMAAPGSWDLILFYQGESDSQSDGDYLTWAQQFTTIANEIKHRKGNVPILYTQIGTDPGPDPVPLTNPVGHRWDHWQDVRDQQASVYVNGAKMVRADGLPTQDDKIHLTVGGFAILASYYARTFLYGNQ